MSYSKYTDKKGVIYPSRFKSWNDFHTQLFRNINHGKHDTSRSLHLFPPTNITNLAKLSLFFSGQVVCLNLNDCALITTGKVFILNSLRANANQEPDGKETKERHNFER